MIERSPREHLNHVAALTEPHGVTETNLVELEETVRHLAENYPATHRHIERALIHIRREGVALPRRSTLDPEIILDDLEHYLRVRGVPTSTFTVWEEQS